MRFGEERILFIADDSVFLKGWLGSVRGTASVWPSGEIRTAAGKDFAGAESRYLIAGCFFCWSMSTISALMLVSVRAVDNTCLKVEVVSCGVSLLTKPKR